MMQKDEHTTFSDKLLRWYDNQGHNFPWRGIIDPYKTWLSEVMLQQTQVHTVIPYFKRWLQAFPNIKSVASADMDTILKQWEGLGYYARARNFHAACKIVESNYLGEVPNDIDQFSSLPGAGSYISGAVMSIAFNQPVPALDANAFRVVSRLQSVDKPFSKCKNEMNEFLSDLICTQRPGDFNQAIMDLGRNICTPINPHCTICPLSKYCSAFVNKTVSNYPVKLKSRQKPHYRVAVGVIWKNEKILISKRRENGLLGGLWEFPGGKIEPGESAENCIIREVQEELGVCVKPTFFLKQIKHAYTHFSITLDAYYCEFIGGKPQALGCLDWQWATTEQIQDLPFPKANHKLFDKVLPLPTQ